MAEMSPLRRRMIEDMTVRNMSPATQRSYISGVAKFSRYFGRSPDKLTLDDVHAFQVHLVSTGISWLVPDIERQPLKKLSPDENELLKLVHRWRIEAAQAGRVIKRIVIAYEAGRDGFWLARWLRRRGIEAYVIHPSSVAVSREHRRAKTDRLDTELLLRAFLGWLRGEKRHCSMAAIPTIEDEDAKRPSREHEKLVGDRTRLVNRMKAMLARFGIRTFKPTLRKAEERLDGLCTAEGTPLPENTRAELRRDMMRLRMVREQIKEIEQERLRKLTAAPAEKGPPTMVRFIARIIGIGIETADMLVSEILSRGLRDSKAVARYAGLTGAPDESGRRRRGEEGTGEGFRQGGQRAGAARHDPARLAPPHLPEG